MRTKAQLEAEIQGLKNELKSLQDTIKSLENDQQFSNFALPIGLAVMSTNQSPLSKGCLVVDEDIANNIILQYLARVALAKLAQRGDKEEEAYLWGHRYIECELAAVASEAVTSDAVISFRVLHDTTKNAPVSEILRLIKRRLMGTIKRYEQDYDDKITLNL